MTKAKNNMKTCECRISLTVKCNRIVIFILVYLLVIGYSAGNNIQ